MRGCAGDPASRITGGEWRVEAVAGEAIVAGATVSIAFSDAGRVTGHSGCNRFTGRYTRTGEGLSFGKLASTMMACPEALMRQERRVLEVLARVTRFDIDETGQLLLIGDKNDHALLTARRP